MADTALKYAGVWPQPRMVHIEPDGVTHAEVLLPPQPSPFSCFPRAAPAHPRVALSPLDTIMFVRPMQMCAAFFFGQAVDPEALCLSLGRTLRRFPMLSGRLVAAKRKNRFDVELCDAGVPLDVFECSGTIAEFNGNADWTVVDRNTQPVSNTTPPQFWPKMNIGQVLSGQAALMAVRLTRLRCGGCILGVVFSHMIADGIASGAFCSAWSAEHEAMLAGKTEAPPLALGAPVFERSTFEAATVMPEDIPEEARANASVAHQKVAGLVAAVTARSLLKRGAKIATDVLLRKNCNFTLHVTGPQMAQARAAASQAAGTALSANDVCIGIAWALLRTVRSRGVDGPPRLVPQGDAHQAEHFMLQTVDLRRFLALLPPAYFGNASWAIRVAAPVGTRNAAQFAACSRASLEAFTNSTAVFDQLGMALSEGSKPAREQLKAMLLPAFGDGMLSSWHYPAVWKMSWGAGKPVWWAGDIYPVAPWHVPPLPHAMPMPPALTTPRASPTRHQGLLHPGRRPQRRGGLSHPRHMPARQAGPVPRGGAPHHRRAGPPGCCAAGWRNKRARGAGSSPGGCSCPSGRCAAHAMMPPILTLVTLPASSARGAASNVSSARRGLQVRCTQGGAWALPGAGCVPEAVSRRATWSPVPCALCASMRPGVTGRTVVTLAAFHEAGAVSSPSAGGAALRVQPPRSRQASAPRRLRAWPRLRVNAARTAVLSGCAASGSATLEGSPILGARPAPPAVLGPIELSAEDQASLQTTAVQRAIFASWLALQACLWAKAFSSPQVAATILAAPLLSVAHAGALCVAAWVAADLAVGIFHFFVDNYGSGRTPLIGHIVAGFQGHHDHPWLITRGQLCTVIDGPCVATAPMLVAALAWCGPRAAVFMAWYTAWSVLAQLTHKWSHERRCSLPPLVAALQDARVFISCREHRKHHLPPISDHYCILSGLWNQPLDALRVIPAIERAVFQLTGVMPRSWCGKVPGTHNAAAM